MHPIRVNILSLLAFGLAALALLFNLAGRTPLATGAQGRQDTTGGNPEESENVDQANAVVEPLTFAYQGTLRRPNGTLAANGTYKITFAIYNTVIGGEELHRETHEAVAVRGGVYNVVFGDLVPLAASVLSTQPRFLGVAVDPDPEMMPRLRLHPVPWAIASNTASTANTLKPGATIQGGVTLNNPNWDGVRVLSPGASGIYVEDAGHDGIHLTDAAQDGIQVNSPGLSGMWVNNAGGSGVWVSNPDDHGFAVINPGEIGVIVQNSGNDGVAVSDSGRVGVGVWGAVLDGFYVEGAARYEGNFQGNIIVTGDCSGCNLASFGVNASQSILEPGNVVTIRGITFIDGQERPVLQIDLAAPSDTVIGVVRSRAELDQAYESEQGQIPQMLVPRSGPAQPGEYVSIVTYGLVQVKIGAANSLIQPGSRLTIADQAGRAAVRDSAATAAPPEVDVASIIGTALEQPAPGQELIWVLVDPR